MLEHHEELCVYVHYVCVKCVCARVWASKDEPRRGHAVCTLRVHPPTSLVPPFLLTQNLSPKDIARSDIMKLKVS